MNSINSSKKGLTSLVLKIIAIISMTLDHIGYFLNNVFSVTSLSTLSYIFRVLGRLSIPLFIFLLIEGLTHTKNIKKYLLRLGIEALLIYLAITLIQVLSNKSINLMYSGNIFVTLFLLASIYYFLYKSKFKILVILPIIYIILNFITKFIFINGYYTINEVSAFIYFNGLFLQYDILAPSFFLLILLGYKIYDYVINKKAANNQNLINEFKETKDYQRSKNIIVCIIIALLTLICYVITYLPIYEEGLYKLIDGALQTYMLLSALIIYFYNGRKGYSSKIIQYGCYIYYPLHLFVIYLICYLLF